MNAPRNNAEHKAAALKLLEERLHFAVNDMDDVAETARFLLTVPPDGDERVPLGVRLALETGMYVTYARSFNVSRGTPPLPRAPINRLLTAEQRMIHDAALRRRDTVGAHVEREAEHRRLLHFSFRGVDVPDSVESFTVRMDNFLVATEQELQSLAELAEHLAGAYRERLIELNGHGSYGRSTIPFTLAEEAI